MCDGRIIKVVWSVQGVTTKKGMVSSDAINISPDVKRSIVTLRGRLGGELFEVTRTRTASKSACPKHLLPVITVSDRFSICIS